MFTEIPFSPQTGCSGYIIRNVAFPVLVEAIEKVYNGEVFLEPQTREQLLQSLLSTESSKKEAQKTLTQREQKILELIAQGHTNVQIAQMLYLSYRTIQNNRLTLHHKFSVHNTAGLIKEALQQGGLQ